MRTAPKEKLTAFEGQLASRRALRFNSQSAESGEQVVIALGNVLEKQRAIRGHRSSDACSETKECDAKPEEGRSEGGEDAEDRGEEKGEVEGRRSAL